MTIWHGDVLIFDQFEEVLTVDPTDREAKLAFFEQIGAALRDRNRWALFSMREEFVASLDPYLRPIPARFDKGRRYRLDLLGPDAAREAMQGPAADQDPPVAFTDAAARKLADDLRRVQVQQPDGTMAATLGQYIEPVQLQVVCRRLWDGLAPDDMTIDLDDLAAVGDVDTALRGYYADTVKAVGEDDRRARAGDPRVGRPPAHHRGGDPRPGAEGPRAQPRGGRRAGQRRHQAVGGCPPGAIRTAPRGHLVRAGARPADRAGAGGQRGLVRGAPEHLAAAGRAVGGAEAAGRAPVERGGAGRGRAMGRSASGRLEPHERDFLATCQQAREQAERERRQSRRIRMLALAAAAVAVVAVIAAVFGVTGQQRAKEAENTAVAQATRALNAEATAKADRAIAQDNANVAATREAEAVAEKKRADEKARIAQSRQLASQAAVLIEQHESAEISLLLAVESARVLLDANLPPALEADAVLRRTLDAAPVAVLPHEDEIAFLAFSPDGTRLATITTKGMAALWDATDGRQVFARQLDEIAFLAFSPDSPRLATITTKGMAALWDAMDGRQVLARQLAGRPLDLVFSTDAPLVATSAMTGTVDVWNLASGQRVRSLEHDTEVGKVIFHPSGRLIATDVGQIYLWDLESGQRRAISPREGTYISPLVFSPDRKRLATVSRDPRAFGGSHDSEPPAIKEGLFQVWDVATGDEVARLEDAKVGLSTAVGGLVAGFSSDGNLLAFGETTNFGSNQSGTNVLWNLTTNGTQYLGSGVPLRFGFSPRDEYVFVSYLGNLNIASGTYVAKVDGSGTADLKQPGSPSAAFSPDGQWLATGGSEIQLHTLGSWATAFILNQGAEGTREIIFSPDASRLAALTADGLTVWLWDVSLPGKQTILRHAGQFKVAVPGPDKTRMVTWDGTTSARLWDTEAGTVIASLPTSESCNEGCFVFSRNGAMLATRVGDAIQLWDPATGREKATLNQGSQIEVQTFSPDDTLLAVAGGDAVTLWDMARMKPRCIAQGSRLHLYSGAQSPPIAFSPSGDQLAAVGDAVQVWDTATCGEIASLIHEYASGVAYASTGDRLNTISSSTIKSWDTIAPFELLSAGSPDSTLEISSSGLRWAAQHNGVFEVWDVMDGRRLSILYHRSRLRNGLQSRRQAHSYRRSRQSGGSTGLESRHRPGTTGVEWRRAAASLQPGSVRVSDLRRRRLGSSLVCRHGE